MDGPTIVQSLIARGYSPVQAAALGGHILQESGGDPANVNRKEDAHGLLQWRLDRWDNLQKMARDRGVSPTDPNTQLDFIGHELGTSEANAGKAFYGAGDNLGAASGALKKYIRFGDDSDATRLNNAKGLLGIPGIAQAGMLGPQATPSASGATPAAAGANAPDSVPAAEPDNGYAAMMKQLQSISPMLQAQQQTQQFAPAAPIPDNMAARLAAIAAAKQGIQPT